MLRVLLMTTKDTTAHHVWNGLFCAALYLCCLAVILYGTAVIRTIKGHTPQPESETEWKSPPQGVAR